MRGRLKDLAFGLLVASALWGLCEGLLWVLGLPRATSEEMGLVERDAFGHSAGEFPRSMRLDPDLLWSFKPDNDVTERLHDSPLEWSYHVNHDGFRGAIPPGSGSVIVLCAGDSVTAGYGVPDETSYPTILERELRAVGVVTAHVANTGVNGYSSEQGRIQIARTMPRYKPAVVVLEYGINDDWLTAFPDSVLLRPSAARTTQRILGHSRIYRLLRLPIVRGKVERELSSGNKPPRVALDRYGENLRAMVASVRAAGAAPILVAPTSQYEAGARKWPPSGDGRILASPLSDYRKRMAEVASAEKVPFVDVDLLSGRLPESPRRFVDWCHPDAEGLAILARAIAPEVERCLAAR